MYFRSWPGAGALNIKYDADKWYSDMEKTNKMKAKIDEILVRMGNTVLEPMMTSGPTPGTPQWMTDLSNLRRYVEKECDEDHRKGWALGRESGMSQGREEGMSEGREEGMSEGRAEGREAGMSEGRAAGMSEGRAMERGDPVGFLRLRKERKQGLPFNQRVKLLGSDGENVPDDASSRDVRFDYMQAYLAPSAMRAREDKLRRDIAKYERELDPAIRALRPSPGDPAHRPPPDMSHVPRRIPAGAHRSPPPDMPPPSPESRSPTKAKPRLTPARVRSLRAEQQQIETELADLEKKRQAQAPERKKKTKKNEMKGGWKKKTKKNKMKNGGAAKKKKKTRRLRRQSR